MPRQKRKTRPSRGIYHSVELLEGDGGVVEPFLPNEEERTAEVMSQRNLKSRLPYYVFFSIYVGILFGLAFKFSDLLGWFEAVLISPLTILVYIYPEPMQLFLQIATAMLVLFTLIVQCLQQVGIGKDLLALRITLMSVHIVIAYHSLGSTIRIIISISKPADPYNSPDPTDQEALRQMNRCRKFKAVAQGVSLVSNVITAMTSQIIVTKESSVWMQFWGSLPMGWVLTVGGVVGNWGDVRAAGSRSWKASKYCWGLVKLACVTVKEVTKEVWESEFVVVVRHDV